MINLKPVKPKDKELLWNINQKYLYEMTGYYDDEMDENGNYHQLKITSSFYYPLKNDEKLNAKLNLPKRLSNKIKSGEIVGKIEIYGLKQLIFSQNIYTL